MAGVGISRRWFTGWLILALTPIARLAVWVAAGSAPKSESGKPALGELANQLSEALEHHEGGAWFATVLPQTYPGCSVTLALISEAIDRELGVSPRLVRLLCGHAAAYAEFGRLARLADSPSSSAQATPPNQTGLQRLSEPLGRAEGHCGPSGSPDSLDSASEAAGRWLLALCRYRPRNAVEHTERAIYLLGFLDGDELEHEQITALLRSALVRLVHAGEGSVRPGARVAHG